MNSRSTQRIKAFVRSIERDSDFLGSTIKVRGRALAQFLNVRELRTQKHSLLAVAFDVLGNATILSDCGGIMQLVGAEADMLPR